jgi:hypothetical protein
MPPFAYEFCPTYVQFAILPPIQRTVNTDIMAGRECLIEAIANTELCTRFHLDVFGNDIRVGGVGFIVPLRERLPVNDDLNFEAWIVGVYRHDAVVT